MIDIVLCCSILEKCKSVDAFSEDLENVEMVRRIRQHRMVISEKLMDYYETYFEEKAPEWLEWYRGLCTELFYTKERSVIVKIPDGKCYIRENGYQNELFAAALCKETEDKIILMDSKNRIKPAYVKKFGISVFDSKDIIDAGGNNLFSMYTLPVNGKSVPRGEDSAVIARWLGRFLRKEKYIQIFDSYLLTEDGIRNLKKYILKYIAEDADIEIYSLKHDDYSEQQIQDKFLEEYYSRWRFSIFWVNSKKDLHARSIQGSKYIIQIDRGLSVFGKNGETYQSLISIYENNGTPRIVLKESKLKKIFAAD